MLSHLPMPGGSPDEKLGLLAVVMIPLVFLLGWLYNSWRMGRFAKKPRKMGPQPHLGAWWGAALILMILLLSILVFLAGRFLG